MRFYFFSNCTNLVKVFRLIFYRSLFCGLVFLGACATKIPELEPAPQLPPPSRPIEPALSPLPITDLSTLDIRFVQAALNELGFNAGPIDGLWGPQSARAIRLFETAYQLASADGFISELNLSKLTEISSVKKEEITSPETPLVPQTIDIQNQLTNQSFTNTPTLIVTEEDYDILSKPNPYSQVIQRLPAGTGIYIIDVSDDWYQIETLDRKTGFIQQ